MKLIRHVREHWHEAAYYAGCAVWMLLALAFAWAAINGVPV